MRLTLVDLLKLVFSCAMACACLVPTTRLVQEGITSVGPMLIVDAMIVPLVWVLMAFALVRRGPKRTVLIDGLILGAVSIPVGLGGAYLGSHVWRLIFRGQLPGSTARAPAVLMFVLELIVVPLALWLVVRLTRGIRLLQGRSRLALDPTVLSRKIDS